VGLARDIHNLIDQLWLSGKLQVVWKIVLRVYYFVRFWLDVQRGESQRLDCAPSCNGLSSSLAGSLSLFCLFESKSGCFAEELGNTAVEAAVFHKRFNFFDEGSFDAYALELGFFFSQIPTPNITQ